MAGNGPPPGSHHRDTGEEHPALSAPGLSGPSLPGHHREAGGPGMGSRGGPLPVCLPVHQPWWSQAPEYLGLVSLAWLSYLLL